MRKKGLLHTLKCLYKGQSLLRIRMNEGFAAYPLRGTVVDVGGGRNPDYFLYFKKDSNVVIKAFDGSMNGINFENDALPLEAQYVDTAILANVLEHIYNHQFLLGEVRRILRKEGQLIGFVPFWIGYHADPHDYFRYTHEAIKRMLDDSGYTNICITALSVGPVLANFNTVVLSFPRFLRPLLYLWYAPINALFVTLRPDSAHRNPLGYIFTATAS